MSKDKNKLVPELRFPEFENEGEWEEDIVDKLISTVTPPKKLTTSNYLESGRFPIIDQSKSFYCGWTNDADAVITENLPLIIFGDHTCILKMAIEPFVQGADGIKILKPKNKITPEFLYHFLQHNEVKQEEYKRHFSILKERNVLFPKIEKGEQQKIACCLSSLDEVIAAHSQKLDTLKDHKKGLMQNLFPQEGEKAPNYRFPEFEKDGCWGEKELGVCLSQKPEYGINAAAVPYSKKLPKYLRITDISEDGIYLANGKVSVDRDVSEDNYLSAGDIVLARTGASVGKSYKYRETDGRLVFAGFLIRVKPDIKKLDSELLFQFLSTSQYWKWVSFISARSGQPGINGTEYSAMPICLPPTINEQQKIASCLSSLDVLIVTQAEKIEQLQFHKKGLMQGLFPKVID